MTKWKWDWQHVVIGVAGLGCMTAVIALGHGQTLLQLLAALGGTTGIAALLKGSPRQKTDDLAVIVDKEKPE